MVPARHDSHQRAHLKSWMSANPANVVMHIGSPDSSVCNLTSSACRKCLGRGQRNGPIPASDFSRRALNRPQQDTGRNDSPCLPQLSRGNARYKHERLSTPSIHKPGMEPSFLRETSPGQRIDFIFATRKLEPVECRLVFDGTGDLDFVSVHLGVLCVFALK
jgi:hypothetical protein